jgi:hypothetical protein
MYEDDEQKHFTKDMEPMQVIKIQDIVYESFDQKFQMHVAHSCELSLFSIVPTPTSRRLSSSSNSSSTSSSALVASSTTKKKDNLNKLFVYLEQPAAMSHLRMQVLKASHILSGSLVEPAKASNSKVSSFFSTSRCFS